MVSQRGEACLPAVKAFLQSPVPRAEGRRRQAGEERRKKGEVRHVLFGSVGGITSQGEIRSVVLLE